VVVRKDDPDVLPQSAPPENHDGSSVDGVLQGLALPERQAEADHGAAALALRQPGTPSGGIQEPAHQEQADAVPSPNARRSG